MQSRTRLIAEEGLRRTGERGVKKQTKKRERAKVLLRYNSNLTKAQQIERLVHKGGQHTYRKGGKISENLILLKVTGCSISFSRL